MANTNIKYIIIILKFKVRRFVRSYRKFPSPLEYIDTIAQDANLEEKSQATLIEFAKKMQQLCHAAIADYESNRDAAELEKDKKKRERGPELDINGVKVFAYQLLETESYFEPLTYFHKALSESTAAFQFKTKLKQTYWDCEWSPEQDKALLRGIYEYGYGNWEWIKADPELKLGGKILVNDQTTNGSEVTASSGSNEKSNGKSRGNSKSNASKLKPQSKHLRTRLDYLIKVLQNQMNTERYGANWKSMFNVNESSSGAAGQIRGESGETTAALTVSSATAVVALNSGEKSSRRKNESAGSSGNNGGKERETTVSAQNQPVSSKSKRKLKQPISSSHVDSNESDNSESQNEPKVN